MPENWDEIVRLWRTKKITAYSAIKMSGLSRSVFYRNTKLVKQEVILMQWGIVGFVATLGILCIVEGICNADLI